ncbi:MAG: A/G-specific adenine glycosylase [Clostridia bacterium]|nr:A/G-specific adenine glycosylase [Clostridia bacterium]
MKEFFRKGLFAVQNIYKALPVRLLPWFRENARDLPWRKDKNPYRVWLSEIMLQQTRVEAVRGYFLQFLEAFPHIRALAEADPDAVLKKWEGLGYYSRARNLQKAAKVIMEVHDGKFPETYAEILALPGIGAYTAGAISSICFEKPTPAVDGNVLRVTARMTDSHSPIDLPAVKKEVTGNLEKIYPAGSCGDFTQSLMELGATVCTPKSPHCTACPLSDICLAKKHGTAAVLPKKTPKKQRRKEEKTVFFFTCGDKVAVQKRNAEGLLANLWEFPNIPDVLSADAAVKAATAFGVLPDAPTKAKERIHIFTHIEWHMTCYYIPCRNTPSCFVWVKQDELSQSIALPTAFKMFLEDDDDRI